MNERARGDRRASRGILIRVQDVAELAMTVAADTIHTAFCGASFWDQLPNRGLSIYSIHSYRSIECTGGYVWWEYFSQAIKYFQFKTPFHLN